MRSLLLSSVAAVAALSIATASAVAAPVTASPATYVLNNQNLIVTPTDLQIRTLAPGESFSIAGSWSSTYNSGGGCGSCYTQTYLAGLPGLIAQVNLFDPNSQGSSPGAYFSSGSGTYASIFTAPTTPGTYYIGAGLSLDFNFVSGVVGAANGLDQVSYAITVAVPEPATFALFGLGLAGLATFGRRRAV